MDVDCAMRQHAQVVEYALVVYSFAAERYHDFLHMVGDHEHKFVAGLTRLHTRSHIYHAHDCCAVSTHGHISGFSYVDLVRAVGKDIALHMIERYVYVEFEVAHYEQMIPQFAFVRLAVISLGGEKRGHRAYDCIGA